MPPERRLPDWFRVPAPGGPNYLRLRNLVRNEGLHTVCQEAQCPNIGDCWERGAATFMILGDICTWRCHYCAVTTGRPLALDPEEPRRLAETVRQLELGPLRHHLRHPRGPAGRRRVGLRRVHRAHPRRAARLHGRGAHPRLQGRRRRPAHRSRRRPGRPQPQHRDRSPGLPPRPPQGQLRPLAAPPPPLGARSLPHIPTKSGIMVGLGETEDDIHSTMADLREVGCQLLTIGQYLRPSKVHWKLERFYTPAGVRRRSPPSAAPWASRTSPPAPSSAAPTMPTSKSPPRCAGREQASPRHCHLWVSVIQDHPRNFYVCGRG